MAIQVIPRDNSQAEQQWRAIDHIGRSLGQFGQAFEARRMLAEQEAAKAEMIKLLGGDPGSMTAGQLDPRQMTPGSGAGTLGGMPGAPGTAPTAGLLPPDLAPHAGSFVQAGLGPQLAQVGLQHRFPKPGEGFTLNPGDVRYDASGRQIVAAPAETKPPQMRDRLEGGERIFEQYNQATGGWDRLSAGPAFAPPSSTTVNLPPGETRLAQHDADRIGVAIPEKLGAIREEQGLVDTMRQLLAQGTETGHWEGIKERARGLGINLPAGEGVAAFGAAANQQMLSKRRLLPGVLSNSDIQILEGMAGSASTSPQDNLAKFDVIDVLLQREAESLMLQEQYYEQNGSLRGWSTFAKDWAEQNPLAIPQVVTGERQSLPDQAVGAIGRALPSDATVDQLIDFYAN